MKHHAKPSPQLKRKIREQLEAERQSRDNVIVLDDFRGKLK